MSNLDAYLRLAECLEETLAWCSIEHMFEVLPGIEASLPGPPPTGAGLAGALAWSTLTPDGLLAALLANSTGLTTSPENPVAEFEKVERVGAWEKVIAWAQAQQATEIADLVATAEATPDPFMTALERANSAEAEIRLMLHLTHGAAGFRVSQARLLREPFPATLAALGRGAITLPKAGLIADECAVLDPAHAAAVEAAVLPRAPELTLGELRALLRRQILAADPAAAAKRHRRARRDRSVILYPERDGMANLSATLPATEALGIFAVLDEHARHLPTTDHRTMDARRADILTDLLLGPTGYCAAGTAAALGDPVTADPGLDPDRFPGRRPDSGSCPPATDGDMAAADDSAAAGDSEAATEAAAAHMPAASAAFGPASLHPPARINVQIRVTVPLDTLRGASDDPAELAGYGPITADQARQLAAHAHTWHRLVTDPLSGALLDYGTTRYRPPPHLAEYVRARDQTCTHPGCRVPAHRCDLDHTIPYNPDTGTGPTSATNLTPKCRTDHQLKQLPGWTVRQDEDGTITWTTPSRHTYVTCPPPLHPPSTAPPRSPLPEEPPF